FGTVDFFSFPVQPMIAIPHHLITIEGLDMDLRQLTVPIEIPNISGLQAETSRPTWSVMIPTYRRPETLKKTLQSILSQDFGPELMQIQVLENPSEEKPAEELVKEWGQDRVEYVRHKDNLGMVGNWNVCIEKARGEWVHILHDDDLVAPGYYSALSEFVGQNPEVSMIASRAIGIDKTDQWLKILFSPPSMNGPGIYKDAATELCENCWIVCPSALVKRSVYEDLGGFSPSYQCSADWDMWLRIAQRYSIGMIWHPYLHYRIHEEAMTGEVVRNGRLFEEAYSIIRRHSSSLEADLGERAKRRGFEHFAKLAGHHSRLFQKERDWSKAALLADYQYLFQGTLKNYWHWLRMTIRARL
ncbi:MAG: glycosyltransferase, partial [Planctomycetota bacterium]|nr:glycosyltransferase [Planctomycetota bacterium]